MAESFVKQNWLLGVMGTLVFVLGGIAGKAFDNRIVSLEVWKNETDVSRATRTAELRMETVRAMERIQTLKDRLDRLDKEFEHLHEDFEKAQRAR